MDRTNCKNVYFQKNDKSHNCLINHDFTLSFVISCTLTYMYLTSVEQIRQIDTTQIDQA